MTKFSQTVKKLYYDKRVRFLFVGVLNTIVGYGVDALSYYLLCFTAIPNSTAILLSTIIGTVIGTINSYFWNKYFTFRSKKKSFAELMRFILVYVVMIAVSYGMQMGLKEIFGIGEDSGYIYLIKFATLLVTTVLSYLGHNFFSFKTQKATKDNMENGDSAIGKINEDNKNDLENTSNEGKTE